jgi:nitrogen regulatory protein P-II 1
MSDRPASGSLELLFCMVKDYRQLDMILEGFLELGIRGATILDARGMAQVLSADVPIFAGLSALFPGGNSNSHMILSVLEAKKVGEIVGLIEDVCGDFSEPGSGILFTVPVQTVKGLAQEIH